MVDFNAIRLGKSKNSTNFNPENMKNGLALNDFTNTKNTSIFTSEDSEINQQLAKDYETIFNALDEGGNVKGVLETSEIDALKNKIKDASGNNIFSKREALKLLNSLGLNNIKVETFFSFLKNAINFSKKIESSETKDGITTTKYVSENGFQQTVTRGEDGKISKTVIKNISDNTYVIKDGNGNIISGQDKDGEYTRTELGDGKYKIQRGEYFVTYQNINGENVEIGGKDKDGEYTRTELENGKYKIQRGEYFVTYQNINGKNVIIGGRDEDGEYKRTELENGKYAQTYTDENNLRRKTRVQTFNSNNKLLLDVVTDAKGRLTEKTVYERNEKGDCTKKTEYDANGNVTYEYVSEYTYDDKGNKIKDTETWMDKDGNMRKTNVEEYEYDDKGNVINRTYTEKDKDGNVLLKIVHSGYEQVYGIYQRDSNGEYDENIYQVSAPFKCCLQIKNNDEDDKNLPGNVGDYITTAKNGETFEETMNRLGITDKDDIETFKKANLKASKTGWFIVGELNVVIPKNLAEKLDIKNNIEKYLVNIRDEIDNYEYSKDKRPAVSP